MIRATFIFFSIILYVNCIAQKEIINLDGHSIKSIDIPNMVRVGSNFYADSTEMTNIAYKEYLNWTKVAYGINSIEYFDALPDAAVWAFQDLVDSLHVKYLYRPEFDDYPVVGINLKQSKKYADWRTERVAEMLLLTQGLIKFIPNQTKENRFTIEKFLSGNYYATIKLTPSFVFPRFSIPTVEEWELLAGLNSEFEYGIDSLDAHNQTLLEAVEPFFHTNTNIKAIQSSASQNVNSKTMLSPTVDKIFGAKNIYGLYNTIGNVSEIVDQKDVAKGGNWKFGFNRIELKKNFKRNIPNCWTGFRCVARLEVGQVRIK